MLSKLPIEIQDIVYSYANDNLFRLCIDDTHIPFSFIILKYCNMEYSSMAFDQLVCIKTDYTIHIYRKNGNAVLITFDLFFYRVYCENRIFHVSLSPQQMKTTVDTFLKQCEKYFVE